MGWPARAPSENKVAHRHLLGRVGCATPFTIRFTLRCYWFGRKNVLKLIEFNVPKTADSSGLN
jgi:hypothetical protein